MDTVAALLKKAREKKGLKTREISRLLTIDQALVSKFENGQRRPTKAQIGKLSQLLEIDLQTITVLWIKEKILADVKTEEFGLEAFRAAAAELGAEVNPQTPNAIDELFEEMEALKNKLEGLRHLK
jgi:cell filamentation protein, protein adenylyltransferase